ncbi:MAG: hypothetical protein IPO64_13250 [Bacteroidetes bacterium]|nr:hypothetical protein [Bacteroidota bacterium]
MTSDQHIEHILTGQHSIRQADRPNVFYFFPTAQNILKFFTSRTSGTFGFARHTSRPFAKPKEPLFCQRTDININFETKENK